jgi:hypothetical protein
LRWREKYSNREQRRIENKNTKDSKFAKQIKSKMKKVKIGWFSCGITSAVACKLAIDKYPNVELYYIEISTAHDDNERFISDCEKWYGKKINRIRSRKYKDQFEVWEKTGYVNGVDGARCSTELKKEVRYYLEQEMKPNLFEDNAIIENQIFGFEFVAKEINRALDFKMDFPHTHPLYPLIDEKLTKPNCGAILQSVGIELPIMYALGYNNNNCIGCTKGGKGYWNKIRIDFPLIFERAKEAERNAGHSCINGTFLDELSPEDGRTPKPIIPECSVYCEEIMEGYKHKQLEKILCGEISINDILIT